ncbi:hypothetical protein BCR33DRAFT_720888 [Rhizoclosmatium globosum]|uniref:Uncharacterized protein n=1 Tax=Rhizoclosmatium globosum TaxID=329046 RepID=A0A1Y2BTV0_9FUNG|nr:hypothetical protein BCR33DRAFT_720888 [Rhizoclosmatium globosum]|eukprot:ORY38182.1 hypothetical protein BCR33DRAFT_720888 [Rhizoclosmatium globosum]
MALNPSRGSTPSSRLFSVFARTGSASTLDTSKAFTPEPINVSILVAGLSDSSENEAMLFFRIHIVKLPAPADSSAVTLESVPLLAAPSIKNAADVMLETDNIPALTSCLGNLCRNQEDLIVVGESVVQRNSDYFASGHKEPGLEHWLAYTSVASVAIVRGHK